MEPRISLITLGVADIDRAAKFYEAIGWKGSSPDGEVWFFQANGLVLGLWDRAKLEADTGTADSGGWGGVTLAYNVSTEHAVDAVLTEAEHAGARISRPAARNFWGGYSGVFIDPDGHPWEVAVNPHWTLDAAGNVTLP